ncbi:aminopeptidase Q-like [Pseudomyrmex gracilis]|uniref:aminopeptidase Q-like n=1 Tax=Pseudomyrmex gracilis TaxID=219809 RepID=UPI000995A23A|nr:aminopeptidase Q-like [Pseudomyrmex gracilis]
MRYKCILEKVATIFQYVNQNKEEKYLILPRIPAEWIFPYWENPAIKAKFTIRINHDVGTTALSHMPGDSSVERNKVYTSFSITPVMSTQLVATVVIPYECAIPIVLLDSVTIATRLEVRKDILYASFLIENITIFLREKVKDVIVASHVRYVALPINSSSYNTIVTTGLVLFRDADIAYNKEVDSIIRKTEVTCLVVRSVIQEMFSNWLVELKQSDPWFVEGFSTFYGVYLFDQIYNETLLMSIVVQARRVDFEYTQAFSEYDLPMQKYTFLQNVTFNKMWKEKAFTIFYMMNNLFRNQDVLYNTIFKKALTTYYK